MVTTVTLYLKLFKLSILLVHHYFMVFIKFLHVSKTECECFGYKHNYVTDHERKYTVWQETLARFLIWRFGQIR